MDGCAFVEGATEVEAGIALLPVNEILDILLAFFNLTLQFAYRGLELLILLFYCDQLNTRAD